MNLKEYISSGVLESYVLGLCTDQENAEVLRMMQQHPEVKAEIEAIETALIAKATSDVKSPPAHVRQNVMAAIESSSTSRTVSLNALDLRKSSFYKYAAAASIALLIISLAANYFLYNDLTDAQQKIVTLDREKSIMASDYTVQKTKMDLLENENVFIKTPGTKQVMLKGMPASPSSSVMVFWNNQTHEVYLSLNKLPAPPKGKQYQLWALANGKPVDAGVFLMEDSSSMQKMKNVEQAQAFAVTLEEEGGSPVPSLGALYAMGNL